ncbi:MAG: primosomal protein [Hydrocarboniphaga sp.]|uniref:primosomal protein N' n=1 Tax=Hydrocarboniphaga sp. TaxID=2033016 RepID=UPI002634DE9B|nr:primosomal protein N' [Hydrocarboniphaga sp.]MDB5972660.1 primosomal protein [Hydrocarboniphaga sp.]
MTQSLVSVAVPVPLYTAFDYLIPAGISVFPGCRVRLPFGRRELTGVVLKIGVDADPNAAAGHYRELLRALDTQPLLSEEQLALAAWIADYYRHPIGEVVAAMLPVALRGDQPALLRQPLRYAITPAGREALSRLPARALRLRGLLTRLAAAPAERAALVAPAAVLRRALAEQWIGEQVEETPTAPTVVLPAIGDLPALTEDQARAVDALAASPGFGVHLLHGVTGSGKTEVYLRAITSALAAGHQVLVLVPEIGLTPQLLERVRERFGAAAVAGSHSALSETERGQVWLRARSGTLPIVVGTRSAVLLPLPRLGLVIVDEEHDVSFKQQDGLRYSARDLAVLRGQRVAAPVILGSATPSLESLAHAQTGRYAWLRLPQRVRQVPPPRLQLLDMRGLALHNGLSPALAHAVARHLHDGGQVLLFINRRGYAPALLCHDCGWTAQCRHCDARMTLHRGRGRLICHHCGAKQAAPRACPQCQSRQLVALGQGTERVEEALRERFPEARVERFDSDRLRSLRALDALLRDTREGRVNILVGTQMLAKGHDFAGLSLVGIVDADQALFSVDFRALERMGQLLTQVAGRAGRADKRGEVLVQTHQPEHPALLRLVEQGYDGLAELLIAERRIAGLPPFAYLALLRAEAKLEDAAIAFLEAALACLPVVEGLHALGPVPAPMERRAGRYRAQLLLQAQERTSLHRALKPWPMLLDALPGARAVRWSLDVDPVDLY